MFPWHDDRYLDNFIRRSESPQLNISVPEFYFQLCHLCNPKQVIVVLPLAWYTMHTTVFTQVSWRSLHSSI